MRLSDWPAAERPREKLLAAGPDALSDAELLALCLQSGLPGHNAVELARGMLSEFNGLRGILSADRGRFCRCRGLGLARYAQLQAMLELARRHYREALVHGPGLTSPAAARDYLHARLRDLQHELFCCLYLDSRNRVLAFQALFRGTLDGASVHPREVVKEALAHNAAALILAHNHPSGIAEPSQADELITLRLKEALALVDIRLLDHLVIGDGRCESFAERGLL